MDTICLRDGYADGQYILPPLPYDVTALEPFLDAETLRLHHDAHHAAYVAGANAALAQQRSMSSAGTSAAVAQSLAFNLAGHMLHTLYWGNLSPQAGQRPCGELARVIDSEFGSYSDFAQLFRNVATGVQGSGWAVLAKDAVSHRLVVLAAQKHQDALLPRMRPLLVCDVWEHAYYLRYRNNRAAYMDAFMNQICWHTVCQRYHHNKENNHACCK